MDVWKARALLAQYACFSPVRGGLYQTKRKKGKEIPLTDVEIAKVLNLDPSDWIEIREEVLADFFSAFPDGGLVLKEPAPEEKVDNYLIDVSPDLQPMVEEVENRIGKKIMAFQMLVEIYKDLKGYSQIPDWDIRNFRRHSRESTKIIDTIGLEKAIRVMIWLHRVKKFVWWNLYSVLKLYDSYYKETYKPAKSEDLSYEKEMFERYRSKKPEKVGY